MVRTSPHFLIRSDSPVPTMPDNFTITSNIFGPPPYLPTLKLDVIYGRSLRLPMMLFFLRNKHKIIIYLCQVILKVEKRHQTMSISSTSSNSLMNLSLRANSSSSGSSSSSSGFSSKVVRNCKKSSSSGPSSKGGKLLTL